MIPLMSLMIGSYIFTKMMVLFGRDDPNDDKTTKIILKVFAIATMIVTVYCVYMIMQSGGDLASELGY